MTDIEKEGELFEQWWEDEGQYHRAGGDDYCKTFAWEAWIFVKNQAIPDGFVVVPKELPEQIAEKMAIDRIDKPRHENDPVWSKIAEQSYKDKVKFKKWEFWRDYKAMIEAQGSANE